MKILITGAAGFIGFHLAKRLCLQGSGVFGIDNLNGYYDVNLKLARLAMLKACAGFRFQQLDIADSTKLNQCFSENSFDLVVNLAAQAGVRYSLQNPQAYVQSNLVGFANVLEACQHHAVKHLLFASSSSVYGNNKKIPFGELDNVDHPISLYAATKKSNELMAHSYSHLYQLPCTGLRFFTVYGPWGRPDMAYFKFVKNILNDQPIDVYNHGELSRDFTYVDDIITGMLPLVEKPPETAPPYQIYNIGSGKPQRLMDFIKIIEHTLGKKARLNFMPMQPGDVNRTYADINKLASYFTYTSKTDLHSGIKNFVEWYKAFYLKSLI